MLVLLVGSLALAGCGQQTDELARESGVDVEPPPTPVITPSADRSLESSPAAGENEPDSAGPRATTKIAAGQGGRATLTPVTQTPAANVTEIAAPPTTFPPATRPPATLTTFPPATRPPATPTTCPPATCPPATPTICPPATCPPATSSATIDYFRANVEEADPGDTITLEWATSNAETVTLWRLMSTGQFGAFWEVAEAGSFEHQIGEHERNRTRFALSITDEDAAADAPQMATLEITLRCPDTWFFENPPDICPARTAAISAGAEQHFQGGLMLWSGGEDRIYVLYGDGQSPKWAAFTDDWDPGEPESDPTLEPPPGLYQPVRGFGQVWRDQPGVRDRLGWALAEEAAYQTAVQRTSYAKYNETYIRAADGGVWRLRAERSGWERQ